MEQYWTDIPLRDVRVSEIGDIIERLSEQGTAELNVSGKIPMSICVVWTVGPEAEAPFDDLWDLRGYIEELNRDLSEWCVPDIGRPEPVR